MYVILNMSNDGASSTWAASFDEYFHSSVFWTTLVALAIGSGILAAAIATIRMHYAAMQPPSRRPNRRPDQVLQTMESMLSGTGAQIAPTAGTMEYQQTDHNDGAARPHDVWEERRRRGVASANLDKKTATPDQPFGSSYYYAHNAGKGGYADGLRMEDYQMNGPKLLAKSGQRVNDDDDASAVTGTAAGGRQEQPEAPSIRQRRPVRVISRYQWDDPGDDGGIACIRIDQLPGRTSTETIDWLDVARPLLHIDARCVDTTSLHVTVQTETVDYKLHIPALYGAVSKVEAIDKGKRLVIKLHKQSSWRAARGNLKAWPHPHKKAV